MLTQGDPQTGQFWEKHWNLCLQKLPQSFWQSAHLGIISSRHLCFPCFSWTVAEPPGKAIDPDWGALGQNTGHQHELRLTDLCQTLLSALAKEEMGGKL